MTASTKEFQNKWMVLVAIGVGTFMTALDGSVVNTILPVINAVFHQKIASVEWIVTIYLLVLSALLLSFGRLGDMRGNKSIYVYGFVIFVIGSALCGLSPNVQYLIAFRALQATGGAMLMANSPAILTKNFPAAQRGQALGLQAAMTYLGLTVGPSLGGWLTDTLGWRSVFYVNVPIGILAIILSMRFIPQDRPAKIQGRFDFAGALLFMAGLVALLIALNQGYILGWTSLPIIGLFGLAAVCLIAFLRLEMTSTSPMLDLSLFKNRGFSAAVASAITNYICIYTIIFLMPFYLIQGRQFSPSQAGLLLTAQPITMAIIAPLAGTLSDRIGIRLLTTIGMALLGLGLYFLSRLGAGSSFEEIMLALSVSGLGTGIFISPNTSGLMGSAPRSRQGIASGVLATARNFGMAIGVGLAGAMFTTLMAQSATSGQQNLYSSLSITFLVTSAIALGGTFISFSRPNTNNGTIHQSQPTQ
jgi:EmrB/QacA subfamily drug resistance transporter